MRSIACLSAVCLFACDHHNVGAPDAGPSLLLQRFPLDLGAIDWGTVMAQASMWPPDSSYPITDFGHFLPPNGANPNGKYNPQPVFHAPLGTPVLAPVTGKAHVSTLYSGDITIQIGENPVWETEHVM